MTIERAITIAILFFVFLVALIVLLRFVGNDTTLDMIYPALAQ